MKEFINFLNKHNRLLALGNFIIIIACFFIPMYFTIWPGGEIQSHSVFSLILRYSSYVQKFDYSSLSEQKPVNDATIMLVFGIVLTLITLICAIFKNRYIITIPPLILLPYEIWVCAVYTEVPFIGFYIALFDLLFLLFYIIADFALKCKEKAALNPCPKKPQNKKDG